MGGGYDKPQMCWALASRDIWRGSLLQAGICLCFHHALANGGRYMNANKVEQVEVKSVSEADAACYKLFLR